MRTVTRGKKNPLYVMLMLAVLELVVGFVPWATIWYEEEIYMNTVKKKTLHYGMLWGLGLFLLFLVAGAQPAKAFSNTTTISTNGKKFYLITRSLSSQYKTNSKLYLKTNSGRKLVASMNYDGNAGISYSLSYGKKMYFCVEDSGLYYNTYTYTIGKKGFQKERNNLKLIERRGKYAIAYIHEATDVGPNRYCLYNLSSKRCINLGYGYGIKFIGKRVYYVNVSRNLKQAQVICCNYNGSYKKVLKKLKSSWRMSGFRFLNAHKVCYRISTYYNWPYKSANKTAKF